MLLEKIKLKSRVDGVILFNNDNMCKTVKIGWSIICLSLLSEQKCLGENIWFSLYIDVKKLLGRLFVKYLAKGKDGLSLYLTQNKNLIKSGRIIGRDQGAYKNIQSFTTSPNCAYQLWPLYKYISRFCWIF